MINAALNLVQGAVAQSRPAIIAAQISTTQPAPTSFTDPLYVQNPSQPDNFWTVTDWDADHGGTLPQQGAACALFYDYTGTLRCIWWDGMYLAPSPGGDAAGVLSGTYPNPGMAVGAAATNVGTLGGVLSGTLPDPSFSVSALASLGIARGASSVTFSSSVSSGTVTVSHGLSGTPTAINGACTSLNGIWFTFGSIGASTFQVQGEYFTALSATYPFCWLAVL